MQEKPNQRVLLIGLHNEKALGVRYLANAAEAAGYEAHILFFKGFNSETPEPATENELRLLREEAARINPMLVGVSVMSSLYLETARKVTAALRQAVSAPIAWGGVWATLASDRAVRECDFVMRGEGEVTICEVLDCLA